MAGFVDFVAGAGARRGVPAAGSSRAGSAMLLRAKAPPVNMAEKVMPSVVATRVLLERRSRPEAMLRAAAAGGGEDQNDIFHE